MKLWKIILASATIAISIVAYHTTDFDATSKENEEVVEVIATEELNEVISTEETEELDLTVIIGSGEYAKEYNFNCWLIGTNLDDENVAYDYSVFYDVGSKRVRERFEISRGGVLTWLDTNGNIKLQTTDYTIINNNPETVNLEFEINPEFEQESTLD